MLPENFPKVLHELAILMTVAPIRVTAEHIQDGVVCISV